MKARGFDFLSVLKIGIRLSSFEILCSYALLLVTDTDVHMYC